MMKHKFMKILPWGLIAVGIAITITAILLQSCVDIDEALPHYKQITQKADPDTDGSDIWIPIP